MSTKKIVLCILLFGIAFMTVFADTNRIETTVGSEEASSTKLKIKEDAPSAETDYTGIPYMSKAN